MNMQNCAGTHLRNLHDQDFQLRRCTGAMGNFTRREFLAALSAFPLLLPKRFVSCHPPFHHLLDGAGQPPARALFEQLPASTTGITWQHVNGRSPEYYLAETTGAGCAFFDYDNDGWMDIYLVNSG